MVTPSIHLLTSQAIQTEAHLRALISDPAEPTCARTSDRLEPMPRLSVEPTPFACMASSDPAGNCDLSLRGDATGFVRILDDRTLPLPERPDNRLANTLRNRLANPHIGLLFIVRGVTETFRINGRATILTDEALIAPSAVESEVPVLGILVDIDEAYARYSKALLRSRLWNPKRFVDPATVPTVPTGGQWHRAIQGEDFDADEYDKERVERYGRRAGFY